jgi:cell division protein FtsB
MEQLAALNVKPGDQDSTPKLLTTLKTKLAEEKLAREKAKIDVETLSRANEKLKKTTEQLAAQVPSLETQVKNLDNKVIDLLTELQANELSLGRITIANDDL